MFVAMDISSLQCFEQRDEEKRQLC